MAKHPKNLVFSHLCKINHRSSPLLSSSSPCKNDPARILSSFLCKIDQAVLSPLLYAKLLSGWSILKIMFSVLIHQLAMLMRHLRLQGLDIMVPQLMAPQLSLMVHSDMDNLVPQLTELWCPNSVLWCIRVWTNWCLSSGLWCNSLWTTRWPIFW